MAASIPSRAHYCPQSHRLRPAESRFSLREQSAMMRRKFEFGFDDASSILERSTPASEAVRGDVLDDAVMVRSDASPGTPGTPGSSLVSRDTYELLCLPTTYHCLLIRSRMQHAFSSRCLQSTGSRRSCISPSHGLPLRLWLSLREGLHMTSQGSVGQSGIAMRMDGVDEQVSAPGRSNTYESRLQEQYLLLSQREARASTDLGVQVDAASLLAAQRGDRRRDSGFEVLKFFIGNQPP
ncbi:hypothetical protein VTK56DRAFT_7176 [Thermocarpiscus australiensis]